MQDVFDAIYRLSFVETVALVFIVSWVLKVGEGIARWISDHTIGPWIDEQGQRLAVWVASRHTR